MSDTERPEVYRTPVSQEQFGIVAKPLTLCELLYNQDWLRKLFVLVIIAALWEAYARWLDNELLVPTFSATVRALTSMKVLLMGFAAGVSLAAVLTFFAISTRIGTDFLETTTAMFNPLPAIALLPLALIWFGLGTGSLVFVLVHSVLWAVALNAHAGFRSVSNTHRMVGQNYGLRGISFVARILIPAAFPNILAGLKIGWAFAWRTLIAAELVFGTTSGQGGLGWYIFEAKNQLDIPEVFAGLLSIILIGLFIENVVFRLIEMKTVRRWGMQSDAA